MASQCWRLPDAVAPETWLALLVASIEPKAASLSVESFVVNYVETTGKLRMRLDEDCAAFKTTIMRLAARVARAINDAEVDSADLGEAIYTRAAEALTDKVEPEPAPEPELEPALAPAEPAAEGREPAAEGSPEDPPAPPPAGASAAHDDARKRQLLQKAVQSLNRVSREGKFGLDGNPIASHWRIGVAPLKGAKAKCAARGRHVDRVVAAFGSDDEPDEWDAYDAAGEVEPDQAKARATQTQSMCGAGQRLQGSLGLRPQFECELCPDISKACSVVFSIAAIKSHRTTEGGCVRAGTAKRRGRGTAAPAKRSRGGSPSALPVVRAQPQLESAAARFDRDPFVIPGRTYGACVPAAGASGDRVKKARLKKVPSTSRGTRHSSRLPTGACA